MVMKKIDFHQRNVVDLMAEVIMKLNEIVRQFNRLESRVNGMKANKEGCYE